MSNETHIVSDEKVNKELQLRSLTQKVEKIYVKKSFNLLLFVF